MPTECYIDSKRHQDSKRDPCGALAPWFHLVLHSVKLRLAPAAFSEMTGWLFCGIRFFAGCQGCHPLQETFIFSVGANCVRPSLQTVTFHLRTCNARPYRLGFTHKNSFVFVGIQANSASLRGKFASQKLPPPYGV